MNYLEARKLLGNLRSKRSETYTLAMSGTSGDVTMFIRAEFARDGIDAAINTIPFGTLGQFIATPAGEDRELIVLTSLDLAPEADWRSGGKSSADIETILENAARMFGQLSKRPDALLAYLPAPLSPVFPDDRQASRLEADLLRLSLEHGTEQLPSRLFAMSSYLAVGCPVGGSALGEFAEKLVDLVRSPAGIHKVLVTDLDNTAWSGIVGEDGLDGISAYPDGRGYVHYIYQSFLKSLADRGILLAAVSKNDPDLALAPFKNGSMPLTEDDLVTVIASYKPKSAQIKALAHELNLGLDSFVFIDDNPVEIAEVSTALPDVTCIGFPASADNLPGLLQQLARLFRREVVTEEDRARLGYYRRRTESMALSEAEGADLTGFLRGLGMKLTINERNAETFTRAVQLINKTNQFNINGRRIDADAVADMLASGGKLYTATLEDRTGSHGEIISCLLDETGTVRSFVMSCRVFQRRVEHAFLLWLSNRHEAPIRLDFVATERNEPTRLMLEDIAFTIGPDGLVEVDSTLLEQRFGDCRELFEVRAP
jgi:FkbH-like protein